MKRRQVNIQCKKVFQGRLWSMGCSALWSVLCITMFSACEKYLSETPDNRTQIDSADKISELLVAAYPEATYMDFAETMSDNVSDKSGDPSLLNAAMYRWKTIADDELDHPNFYWNACYKAIAQANQALAAIDALGNSKELHPQKGEALLARAYAHFMLVNFWAKHYHPLSAATDLGIPYVLKPETEFIVSYTRNTVQEVYDLIEKDLLDGLPLVTTDYEEPKFHFTPDAARAFAVRYYLFKGEWAEVIKHADAVLAANPSSQMRDLLGDYANLEFSQRVHRYGGPEERANLLITSAASVYARNWASNVFGLSAAKVDELFLFGHPIDGKGWAYDVFGSEGFNNLPKFEELFVFSNLSAGIGNPYVSIVQFSLEEVLLGRAEAHAMLNNFDLALSDMNQFLFQRTRGYDPGTDLLTRSIVIQKYPVIPNEFAPAYTLDPDQQSFVKAIAEFRRREFYHEGLRWFDVRRFGLEVLHTFVDGSAAMVLQADDPRKQLQIPVFATSLGIQSNPR